MNTTRFNATMPWPLSWDGSVAVRCNQLGQPNPRGGYITWETLNDQNIPVTQIAKLFKPEVKITPVDHDEVAAEVENSPKYDLRLKKVRRKCKSRIISVFGRLGVNHLDSQNITIASKEIDTACWARNKLTGEEKILINPYFLLTRRTFTTYIMMHEVMHKTFFRGRDSLKDHELKNVALDICIHRILASTFTGKPSKTFQKFCQWFYPEDSKTTVLALCNPSLTENDLRKLERINPLYAQMWNELYGLQSGKLVEINPKTGRKKTKNLNGLYNFDIGSNKWSPDNVYFRLKHQLSNKDRAAMKAVGTEKGMNPFAEDKTTVKVNDQEYEIRTDPDLIPSLRHRKAEKAVRRSLVPKRFRYSMTWESWSDARTSWWDKFIKKAEDLVDPKLIEYARRIQTEKIIDSVAGKVVETFRHEVVSEPYPQVLSEDGQMLAILGFRPPVFPYYQNLKGAQGKRKVIAFFDLSPSTQMFWPYFCRMCDIFEHNMDITFVTNNSDEGMMTFAGGVKQLNKQEIEDMRKGILQCGHSTSFDSVVEHCTQEIKTQDIDAVVTFTDGLSAVSPQNIDAFNQSGKKMYSIYFLQDYKENIGKKTESDLDLLNGESYTLVVPPSDEYCRVR